MQSERDASLYITKVIYTKMENDLIDIIVMEIGDKGITVKQLKKELSLYKSTFPVFIKENRLKPIRFPYEIIDVENRNEIVLLKLPQLMRDRNQYLK